MIISNISFFKKANRERYLTWLYDVVDQENSWPILCVKANELTHQLVTFIAQFMKNGIDINYGEDFYKMVFDSLKQLSSRSEFLEKVEENILYNLINTVTIFSFN